MYAVKKSCKVTWQEEDECIIDYISELEAIHSIQQKCIPSSSAYYYYTTLLPSQTMACNANTIKYEREAHSIENISILDKTGSNAYR